VQGDYLEAQQIIAVLDAGRNRRFLDTTGGDLQGTLSKPSRFASIWTEALFEPTYQSIDTPLAYKLWN
jgi:hypothetical protein